MTAKPATVRSAMRIYYKTYCETHYDICDAYDQNGCYTRRIVGAWLLWDNKDGEKQTQYTAFHSAPVEFVRWPEKTK